MEKGRGAELEINLLLDLQTLVFSDQEFYQTSIFFRDKNNKIDEIFRLKCFKIIITVYISNLAVMIVCANYTLYKKSVLNA